MTLLLLGVILGGVGQRVLTILERRRVPSMPADVTDLRAWYERGRG